MPPAHPGARERDAGLTAASGSATATATAPEASLLDALREGDERAFESLVADFHTALIRTAITYVRDPAAAEDVVQETWVGFLNSLERFEGRCSIKTWLFRILFNKAQSRVAKDQKLVPLSTLAADAGRSSRDSVDPSNFHGAGDAIGHWVEPPTAWAKDPEQLLEDKEALAAVKKAMSKLPPAQRAVMSMRDVEGLSSREVCNVLGLTRTNQRVLLHRARTKVRQALAARYGDGI